MCHLSQSPSNRRSTTTPRRSRPSNRCRESSAMPRVQSRPRRLPRQPRPHRESDLVYREVGKLMPLRCPRCRTRPQETSGYCRSCRNEMRRVAYRRDLEKNRARVYEESIRRRFGLSLADYEDKLRKQGGLCAICGQPESARNKDGSLRRLQIDHDHDSGQVRDLLCNGCNGGLAGFEDDIWRMGEAIGYLQAQAP